MSTKTTFDDFKNALASVSDGYHLMPGWDAKRVAEALASAPAQPVAMTDERMSLISRLKAQSGAHRYEAETDSADLIDEGVAALSAMTDLLEEARDTIAKLLIKIRRDAPDSAGRLLGYADQVVARVDAALDSPLSAQAAPRHPDSERCIQARNRLNAALHGEGAVIDDLETAVASACHAIEYRAAHAAPKVPEGWTIARDGNEIRVISPVATGPGGKSVTRDSKGLADRLLWSLCDALLSAPSQEAKAQAVPEGDDISLAFAVKHVLNVLQDVHMYGGSDLGPSMWQQVSNAIEFCERALAAAPQPAPSEQRMYTHAELMAFGEERAGSGFRAASEQRKPLTDEQYIDAANAYIERCEGHDGSSDELHSLLFNTFCAGAKWAHGIRSTGGEHE